MSRSPGRPEFEWPRSSFIFCRCKGSQEPLTLRVLEYEDYRQNVLDGKTLGPLHWAGFPERDLLRNWGQPTIPYATLAATVLVQLNEGRVSMRQWPIFLEEQPVLVWLLGYPLAAAPGQPWDMDPRASLPANSIARVKSTRASTSSAQPPNASTARPWLWASSVPIYGINTRLPTAIRSSTC